MFTCILLYDIAEHDTLRTRVHVVREVGIVADKIWHDQIMLSETGIGSTIEWLLLERPRNERVRERAREGGGNTQNRKRKRRRVPGTEK